MITISRLPDETKQSIISGIIGTTSRDVKLRILVSTGQCPLCQGGDPFCPTCGGNSTVEVFNDVVVQATVRWTSQDNKRYAPYGQVPEGDCVVVVDIPQLEKHQLNLTAPFFNVKYVDVDNKRMVVDRYYPKGQPINRFYLVLKEDETLNGERVG